MDKSAKIIVWYICITTIFEFLGFMSAREHSRVNHVLYNIFTPIQFLFLSGYFNYSSRALRKKNIGIAIGCIMLAGTLIYFTLLGGDIKTFDSHVVLVESFLIITLSLVLFYELLASDELYITYNPNFWFISFLLIFWSFTFFYWLIGITLHQAVPENYWWMSIMLWSINTLTYSGYAIVFIFYRKMISH